jgi:hypothetical protein
MADEKQDPAKLKLPNVRLSFPDLWVPKSVKNSDPKYSAHFLIDKAEQEELIKTIKGKIWFVAKEHWGPEKAKKICGGKKFEMCLHEGSEKDDLDGYTEDIMFLTSSSPRRPLVIDRDRSPLTADDRRPYGGCYVNAIVRFWVQDNQFGQRVNAELMGVQFFKDGEPFSAIGRISEDDFEDLGEEEGGKKKDKDKDKKKPKAADGDGGNGGDPEPDDDEVPF